MCGKPRDRPTLIEFANLITKKTSLMSTLNVIKDSNIDYKVIGEMKIQSSKWMSSNKIKAFHSVTRNDNMLDGFRAAVELHGLGRLSPNMVLLGFKHNWKSEIEETSVYYEL